MIMRVIRAIARKNILFAMALLFVSMAIGTFGYHFISEFDWVDAFYNAAMIATGMGPADEPPSNGGKIFSAVYALFGAFTFLTVFGVLFTPLFHELMHKLEVLKKENCD